MFVNGHAHVAMLEDGSTDQALISSSNLGDLLLNFSTELVYRIFLPYATCFVFLTLLEYLVHGRSFYCFHFLCWSDAALL